MKPILNARFSKPVSHSQSSFTRYGRDSVTRRRPDSTGGWAIAALNEASRPKEPFLRRLEGRVPGPTDLCAAFYSRRHEKGAPIPPLRNLAHFGAFVPCSYQTSPAEVREAGDSLPLNNTSADIRG